MDKNLLECGICNNLFCDERRPRILPCSHSLCGGCIDMIISTNGIQCPFCRKSFQANSAEEFIINRDLLAIAIQLSTYRVSENSKKEEPSLPKVIEDTKTKLRKGIANCQTTTSQVLNAIETYKEMKKVAVDSSKEIVRQISMLEKLKRDNDKAIANIDMQNEHMQYQYRVIVQQSRELEESEGKIQSVRNFSTGGALIDEAENVFEGTQGKVKEAQAALPGTSYVDNFVKENLLMKIIFREAERKLVNEKENDCLQNITVDDLSSFCGSSLKLCRGKVFASETAETGGRVASISFESENQVFVSHLKDQVIPPKSFVLQHKVFMTSFPRRAFMDLGADGKYIGRIIINITVEGNYALKFLHLCAGDLGPSYTKSRLSKCRYFGSDEHHIEVVEDMRNGQRSTDLVLPEVDWYAEERREIYKRTFYKPGDVRGVHSNGLNARFVIVTRKSSHHIGSDCFGVVEEGLTVLRDVESQFSDLSRVDIIDFGLVFNC